MEDNVGTIVIGTKVNNNELQSGLKKTEKIVKDFDKTNQINPEIELDEKQIKADASKFFSAFSSELGKLPFSLEASDDIEENFDNIIAMFDFIKQEYQNEMNLEPRLDVKQ